MNKYGVPTTVNEVLAMGQKELNQYAIGDLRRIVGVLVSAGNKRLRRLENYKESADMYAYESTMATGGYFSTLDSKGKPKGRNALYHEIIRARNFLNARTSTVKGAMEERKRKERSFFGETREERAKRLKHKDEFESKNQARIKAGKKPLKYRPTKLDRKRDEWNARQRRGDEPPEPSDYKSAEYNPQQAISNTFVLYRTFEKFHPEIVGILGSDTVIEYMGAQSTRYDGRNLERLMAEADERLKERIMNPEINLDNSEDDEPDFWEDYFARNPDRLDYLNNKRAADEAEELAREAELTRRTKKRREGR